MLNKSTMVLVSLVILLCTQIGSAQETLWQTYFDAGKSAYERRAYDNAEKMFSNALAHAEDTHREDDHLVMSLGWLASTYDAEGKYKESELLYKRALSLQERLSPAGDANVILLTLNLISLYERQKQFAQAEPLRKRLITGYERTKGVHSNDVANAVYSLAENYCRQRRYPDAEPLFKRALKIQEKLYGPGHALVARDLCGLGLNYWGQNKLSEAELLFKQSLAIYEKTSGPESTNAGTVLVHLASVISEAGRYLEAEPLFRRVITFSEKYPEQADNLREGLIYFANLLEMLGKNSESEPIRKRLLALDEKKYGPESVPVAQDLYCQGRCYLSLGRYEEAQSAISRSLALKEKLLPTDDQSIGKSLEGLAGVNYRQGKYAEAEPLLKRALQIYEKALGPEHADIANTLNNLGYFYQTQMRYEEAEAFYKRALAMREKTLSSEHPMAAMTLNCLATLYVSEHKYQEAEPLFLRALRLREKAYGNEHAEVAETLAELGKLYLSEGKYAEAEPYMRTAMCIDEKRWGAKSARVAADLEKLGKIHLGLGHKEQGESYIRQALAIKTKLPGGQRLASSPTNLGRSSLPSMNRPVRQKWALVIGVTNFKDPSLNLRYAAKDARDFCNYLIKEAHFAPNHVKLLVDQEASRENVADYLGDKWLRRLARRDDLVVIYVSSHGSSGNPKAGGVNMLLTYDANLDNLVFKGIPMQWLTAGIKDLIPSDRVVLIMDVCHSGAVVAGEKGIGRQHGFDLNKVVPGTGQIVLTSSTGDQVSWEARHEENSVFTKHLIQALRSKGDGTRLGEAYDLLKDQVEDEVLRDRGRNQTPMLQMTWEGNDLQLSVPTLYQTSSLTQFSSDRVPVVARKGAKTVGAKNVVKSNRSKR